MFSGNSEGILKAFELQPSVWKLILSLCPAREAEEVRKVLGDSLVEHACDLHEEASTLYEIWQQVREDSDLKLAEMEASRRPASSSSLPEPPAVRERLVQEIQFFVSYLGQKSEEKGQAVHSLLNSPDNREILDYVDRSSLKIDRDLMSRGSSASGGTCSRPMSAVSSRDGRETPLRLHTPTSEEGSQASVLSDRVEAVNQHVNAFDIDAVVKHLREVLEDEGDEYRQDIAFLQSCLYGEHDFITATAEDDVKPQPTLQELRDLGTKLEHEILKSAAKQRPAQDPLSPAGSSQSSVLKPLLPSLKPRPPADSSPSSKPLKRASRVKLKTKSHPQEGTDSSTATLSPQNDFVCHHHHSDNSGVMVGDISPTADCETVHPGAHMGTKDHGEFKAFSSQNSASVLDVGAVSTKSHVRHKGTGKASGSQLYSTYRLQFGHLENSNNHQQLQMVHELSDGKPIT